MHISDFHYDLPSELIAQYPLPERSSSRLLYLNSETGAVEDRRFTDLAFKLHSGDLLVFNNTRVMPARLFGTKSTGGRIEILVERQIDDQCILAQIRASKAPRPQTMLFLEGGLEVRVIGRQDDFYI
jgi:S-adenosylmethionine:tRNA ribosyltransferase-isomerase